MADDWTRRQLLTGAAGVAAVGVLPVARSGAPAVVTGGRRRGPIVLASANGARFRNGGPRTAVEEAYKRLEAGQDPLAAAVAAAAINELDPDDDSVGYGGMPNAEGTVQLDAAVMHGGNGRAAGVAALEGVRTACAVAHAVAEKTEHLLLVGAGAQEFARQQGFAIEDDLKTESARRRWLEWRRRRDAEKAGDADAARVEAWAAAGSDPHHLYGTLHLSARAADGTLAAVTTTAGLAWKPPGRVGDSSILGAGLYLDGSVGSAGSTGRGEANLYALSCFLIVEEMRRGRHPKDAALEALRRVRAQTVDPRLLNERGDPDFPLAFFVLGRSGAPVGVALYGNFKGFAARYAVCDGNGAEERSSDYLIAECPA